MAPRRFGGGPATALDIHCAAGLQNDNGVGLQHHTRRPTWPWMGTLPLGFRQNDIMGGGYRMGLSGPTTPRRLSRRPVTDSVARRCGATRAQASAGVMVSANGGWLI